MTIELNPADIKRGIVPQRERATGQKRLRDPKRVKLEFRHFADEDWQTWDKYHTADDALKARRNLRRQFPRFREDTATEWRVDGNEVK